MYTITIVETTIEERLTKREWVEGGPDGCTKDGTWGYSPQIPERRDVTRTVLEMTAKYLEVSPVVLAILENSEQS